MARTGGRQSDRRTVGYAVIGLGLIAQTAMLPAFAHAKKNSRLAALVSGDSTKRKALGDRYRVPAFHYEDLDDVLARAQGPTRSRCSPLRTRGGMAARRLWERAATPRSLLSVGERAADSVQERPVCRGDGRGARSYAADRSNTLSLCQRRSSGSGRSATRAGSAIGPPSIA
jgi:hypothetical protein